MGEIVDLNAYRAKKLQRQREKAKRREGARSLPERSDSANTKPDTEPLQDDPA
jgi:hypothetical protein